MNISLPRRMRPRAPLSCLVLLTLSGLSARGQYMPYSAYSAAPGSSAWMPSAPYTPYGGQMTYPSCAPNFAGPAQSYGAFYPGLGGMYPSTPGPCITLPSAPLQPYFFPPHPCLPSAEGLIPGQASRPGEPGMPSTEPRTGQPGETPRPGQEPGRTDTSDMTTAAQQQEPSLPGEQGAAGGGESVAVDAPVFGDLLVPASSFQTGVTPAVLSQLSHPTPTTAPTSHNVGGGGGFAGATVPFHSALNISENEIPRPVDRVWVMYNYYSDVQASGLAFGSPGAQVHREMLGGEKTFLSGNASVGFRLPIFETFGSSSVANSQLGDGSLVFKYAFLNNRRTGDVLSAGMVLTLPTGVALKVPGQSSVNSTYFQPWGGGIFHLGNVYFIDFTSLAAPTDARDVTLFFESFAIGYMVYRNPNPNAWVRGIIPDVEFHANIPLNHSGLNIAPIGFPDMVDFTGGCYFLIRRALLGMAAGTPLTGPKPYGVEGMVSLNYLF